MSSGDKYAAGSTVNPDNNIHNKMYLNKRPMVGLLKKKKKASGKR